MKRKTKPTPSVCLVVETAGDYLGLGLYDFSGKRLGLIYEAQSSRQSESIFPRLTVLFKKTKVGKEDLGLVIVNIGPGSFTGVRVGVAVARGLAQALNIPIVGVNTLEAMAWTYFSHDKNSRVLVHFAALAGEAYYAAYVRDEFPLAASIATPPTWGKDHAWTQTRGGWPAFSQAAHPDAFAAIGLRRFHAMGNSSERNLENVRPFYLQPSWAERRALS